MFNLKAFALLTAGTAALTLGTSSPAQALQFFNFSYSGTGISASGTLTTSDFDTITNTYTITGITGTRNGINIAALLPPGTYPTVFALPNDNILTAALSPTIQGFSFQDANGLNVNVYQEFGFFDLVGGITNFTPTPVNLSITPTPIPTPALLPGLVGLGAAALRKRKQEKVEAEV